MGVVSCGAVVGADDHRVDPGGLLLRPGQSPDRAGAAAVAPQAGGGHGASSEQQVDVDLLEQLTGMWVEQRDSCGEEAILAPPGGGAAVRAVAQISEMAQELRGIPETKARHRGPFSGASSVRTGAWVARSSRVIGVPSMAS